MVVSYRMEKLKNLFKIKNYQKYYSLFYRLHCEDRFTSPRDENLAVMASIFLDPVLNAFSPPPERIGGWLSNKAAILAKHLAASRTRHVSGLKKCPLKIKTTGD
jgi:hypothetical protein